MLKQTQPLHRTLDNGLILKSISTVDEVEGLAEFNTLVHGDGLVGRMTRTMIQHHPSTHPNEWIFVEDPANGKIVSSLCLIPWTLKYGSVTLKSGEMGIVGTLPEYRHQGLIRSLDARFQELLDLGGYHLSQIEGIPYYYRQFGYEYALPLEGGWHLEFHNMPAQAPDSFADFSFRKATVDDIPLLDSFYGVAMSKLDISAVRTPDIWQYLVTQDDNLAGEQETWLVEKGNQVVGYFRIAKQGFGQGMIVDETSYLPYDAILPVMVKLKQMAQERQKPYLRLSMPDSSPLIAMAKGWGAKYTGRYAWQMKIPDPARLLRQIAPVLEQRVQNSTYAGLNRSLILNLYRRGYELVFENGTITAVNEPGFCEDAYEVRIPPDCFTQLVLGHRNREELQAIYPDVGVSGNVQHLIDVLFPKMSAFLQIIF